MSQGKPGTNGNGKAHLGSGPNGHAEPGRVAPKPAGRQIKCPQCSKLAAWDDNPSRPFCSERCRLMDLGQWADGTYAIPAEKVPDKEEE